MSQPQLISLHTNKELIVKKGTIMNYFEWSQEYYDTAAEIANVIESLKNKSKATENLSEKKEINIKIAQYKECYYECMHTANHLMQRYRGVA